MQRKGEKAAGFSLMLLSPPKLSMTCTTSKFQLETFSKNKSDLHLPPPIPIVNSMAAKICYTDFPLYGCVICTNKLQTSLKDCNIYGTVLKGNQELAHFSSKNMNLSDFTLNSNTSFTVPFQLVVPHRRQSNSDQQTENLTINSTFYFRNNETNQKMQLALSEQIEIIDSITVKQHLSIPSEQSTRDPIFQISLTNNFSCLVHKVDLKTIDTTATTQRTSSTSRHNSFSNMISNNGIELNRYKVADSIGVNETVSTYIIGIKPFSAVEISFSIPFCKSSFREMVSESFYMFKHSKFMEQNNSNGKPPLSHLEKQQSKKVVSSRNIISYMTLPGTSFLPVPPVTATLGKIPKAVQALWPFSISISITNTTPTNDLAPEKANQMPLNGILNLKENDSIFLYDYNDLHIPNLQPGKSAILKINIIALKQGKFAFPSFLLAFNKYRTIEVNFDKGIMVIGSRV